MGEVDAAATYAINRDASIRIAQLAKKAGVPRYLFAASCSVYGAGKKLDLDESDPLNPLTAYAKSKIETEQAVSRLADRTLHPRLTCATPPPTAIRRCCVSILSSIISSPARSPPAKSASCRTARRGVRSSTVATSRRAFIAFMNAPKETIQNKAVNVGGNNENYQVRDIADKVKKLVPSAKITYTGEIGADPRNYRVKFDLLNKLLPDFKLQYNLSIRHGRIASQIDRSRFWQKGLDRRSVRPASHLEGAPRQAKARGVNRGLAPRVCS